MTILYPYTVLHHASYPLRNWLVVPCFRKVRDSRGKQQQANPSTQDVDGA